MKVEYTEAVQRCRYFQHIVGALVESSFAKMQGFGIRSDCVFVLSASILYVSDVVQDRHDRDSTATRLLAFPKLIATAQSVRHIERSLKQTHCH